MALQNVMQSLGGGNINSNGGTYGYSALAADTQEIPYSVAGDLICMANEYFQLGNKKEAVKTMLTAMQSEDFAQIAQGLLEMNRLAEKTNRSIFANQDEDNSEDTDEDTDEDDNDSNDDSNDDDLDDDDINDLIEDSNDDIETTAEDENKPDNKVENDEDDDESNSKSDGDKSIPMGETSSTIEASMTAKILANKMSLQGDKVGRNRATDFMKKHSRL